ncbi:Sec-dependent nitrous-oxide reductase [bacterium]|nr:Sec-dependent nitrous-oxide reductase [bacterium]
MFSCGGQEPKISGGASVQQLMQARNLSEADVTAALKTYTPTGRKEEFLLFASGGHGGNLIVIGVPSMRILKYIGVFTPEPWQGYGFDEETKAILAEGSPKGHPLTWGDMHHPALSETNADYDGQFIFVNDKANARIAVVSLADFATKQIVHSGLIMNDHGGTFVTPNTEYVIETAQLAAPLGGAYAPLDQFNEKYRGAQIYWKFDRAAGRIIPAESWAIELPPYMQDLADAGKLASDGWAFCNSVNTERATGGLAEGKPALESGASQNDMDFLHLINWRKAEQVVKAGKTQTIAGMRVISLATAIAEGLLYFVPEPKSPHGVDIAPNGTDIVVSGKLDTHASVYDFNKMMALIEQKRFEGADPYGVPILPFRESLRGQVELGLGPLHTQYDDKGFAYTSIFLESKVAKWSLKDLQLLDKTAVHYNIGHISAAEGDALHPQGKYLVAMNKWAIDRFSSVGPLLPQNFQLLDISGEKPVVVYDMPLPLGEPHYAQMINVDKIKTIDMYTPAGMNPVTMQPDPNATTSEERVRIERRGDGVHVYMVLVRSHLNPDVIEVKQGEKVHIHATSIEQALDATHGFCIDMYNINLSIEPGKVCNVTFTADRAGVFPFYCTEFCSALHLEMAGYLLVKPS